MGHCLRRNSARIAALGSLFVTILNLSFTASPTFGAGATLLWTAPGDDGLSGRASQYDLRISTSGISGSDTLSWWNAATRVDMSGRVPAAAGAPDSVVLSGLVAGTRYYAVLRVADEVPNWSRYSNLGAFDARDETVAGTGMLVGTVRDASTGLGVSGALVQVAPVGSVWSQLDGTFAIAVPAGTSLTVTASLYGFNTVTATTTVASGGSATLNLSLPKLPTGTLLGTVRRVTDGKVLSGAKVTVHGTPLATGSDPLGGYQLTVPQGMVSVRCERPGYLPMTKFATIAAGSQMSVEFPLVPARYYDDAQLDQGWTLATTGDNALTGRWTRSAPVGTVNGNIEVQPSIDNTPDAGTACFVTANGTITNEPGQADVDGGRTTLTSPVLALAGIPDARIVYWRWYSNNTGTNPGEDPLVTQISNNGGAWISVDSLYATKASWQRVEIRVSDYFSSPGNVQVRFIAMDVGGGSIVEAGIDDLEYYSAGAVTAVEETTPGAPALIVGAPRPSPTSGKTEIDLVLPRPGPVEADVFDVQGRRVRVLERRTLPAGRSVIRWNGDVETGGAAASGVYWIRVRAADTQKKVRLIVLR